MKKRYFRFVKFVLDLSAAPRGVPVLFFLLIAVLVPSTLFAPTAPYFLAGAKIILVLLGVNLAACTLRKWKMLRSSTLLVHGGTLVLLAGGLLGSLGFVATVNVYEKTATDIAYDWHAGKDVSLGFSLRVSRINLAFYPVPVKIGVLRNGRREDLVLTRTGDRFTVHGYLVQVQELDPAARDLQLAVQGPDGAGIGTLSTSGRRDLPPDFPLDFKLVAFREPRVRRMWVDLELHREHTLLAAGPAEINGPLRWNGMQFFLTSVDTDRSGLPYAGIQIRKDPGLPVVYGAILMLAVGILLALGRWFSQRAEIRGLVGRVFFKGRG